MMDSSPNASRAGGLEEVIPSDVIRNLNEPMRRRSLQLRCARCDHRRTA